MAIEQLADQARSIRPAAKRVKAMEQREELDAAGRVKTLEGARAGLQERQAGVDAEIAQLLSQAYPGETETQSRDPRRRFSPVAEETSIAHCGERAAWGSVKFSLFLESPGQRQEQELQPGRRPALTAARAPRTSWPRPSISSTAAGGRKFSNTSRRGVFLRQRIRPADPPRNPPLFSS